MTMEVLHGTTNTRTKAKAVGNLVENDELLGLTLEVSELIWTAMIEDMETPL
jgi:hypothetical protein